MGFNLADNVRTTRATDIINAINAGTGTGSMQVYTADKPATKGAVITTQTLLGTLGFAEPAGTVTDGVATYNVMTDDSNADADGIANWTRILDGDGNFVADMTITDENGAGPVKMKSLQVYEGGILHITSFVLTEGNN